MTRNLALAFVVAWTVAVALLVIAVVLALSGGHDGASTIGAGPAVGRSSNRPDEGQGEALGLRTRTSSRQYSGAPPRWLRGDTQGLRIEHPADVRPTSGRIAHPIIGGVASWYPAHGMIGAAGPALRHYLGRHWRGTLVAVRYRSRVVVVRISDYCGCHGGGGRLVDLSDDAFAQLAPLSVGVIRVSIGRAVRVPQLPATDTE